jgi:enoyl-CoA hydratase/carnithine racemase
MTFETIDVDVSPDGVATVTLNRPEVLNAFNDAMCAEFSRLWLQVRSDDEVRAIVLAAAGDRAFSTGVDVSERLDSESPFLDRAQPWAEHEDPGRNLSPRRNEVWKPVIAAVHGMCAGGAFYWIADCDIVVCSPEATFFDPHVTYGFVAALEPIALRYRMPFSDVMRMSLLGLHERMSAERALAAGLVTEIVERDALLGRCQELARVIAGQPAAAVQGTVKALWQSLDVARGQALATALMYTQIGNPIGTEQVDRDAAKPAKPWRR